MAMTGKQAEIVTSEERIRPANSEVERLLGSAAKIKRLTGWSPGHDLDQGLKRTVEWFSDPNNRAGYKWRIYNV